MQTPQLFDLAGRVAVVTGGNGGIGRGIALGLAGAGASVAVLGRNEQKNQQVLSELKAIGVPCTAVKIDVTDRAALEPALRGIESKLGSIDILVNNAGNVSLSGGVLNEPSYSAAKGSIVQLTKSMAIELAPHNIQVNAIAPGWIETDMTAPVKSMPLNAEILSRTPAGRWGQPDEVAGTAVFLAPRASNFVTGTTIPVDGG